MKKTLEIILLLIFFWATYTVTSLLVKERKTYSQIGKEYLTLNEECLPVLTYLKHYKKQNGVYPEKIKPEILPYSKTFSEFKYARTNDKKGYYIEIYPSMAPIEYYYNDEHDNGYNYYVGNGSYDGFLDNENFYKIDKTFHAVTYDYHSRHNLF